MIEFKEGRYFIGIWRIQGKEKDWMLALYTDNDPVKQPKWTTIYRFRYYNPEHPDPFADKDRKSWFKAVSKELSEEQVFLDIDKFVKTISEAPFFDGKPFGDKPQFLPMYSSDPKFCLEQLSKQPWAHMKQVSKEEFEKEYGKKGETSERNT